MGSKVFLVEAGERLASRASRGSCAFIHSGIAQNINKKKHSPVKQLNVEIPLKFGFKVLSLSDAFMLRFIAKVSWKHLETAH